MFKAGDQVRFTAAYLETLNNPEEAHLLPLYERVYTVLQDVTEGGVAILPVDGYGCLGIVPTDLELAEPATAPAVTFSFIGADGAERVHDGGDALEDAIRDAKVNARSMAMPNGRNSVLVYRNERDADGAFLGSAIVAQIKIRRNLDGTVRGVKTERVEA